MKYKVLLIGRNKIMIEDLFSHSNDDEFELQTSSMRYKDIVSHLKHFRPDAIFFCMNQEEKERMDVVVSLRKILEESWVALVLIGALFIVQDNIRFRDSWCNRVLFFGY